MSSEISDSMIDKWLTNMKERLAEKEDGDA